MHMNPAEYVIFVFKGVRAASRAIGRSRSAISNWRKRGLVPAKAQYQVLVAAKAKGLDITPNDLVLGRESASGAEVPFP